MDETGRLPANFMAENEALRELLSRLSEASLRINDSLDFDTVLQEVVDSARALTASRYGAITVLGEAGQIPHFIVSGLTREEHQGLWDMPQGQGFFEYLSGVEEPLRVSNIASHLGALNMPDFLPSVAITSLLVAPIRHQGAGVGTIYLGHGADGGEFTGRMRRRWCSSPLRRPSPTPAGTGTNCGPGPTWRR